MPGGIPIDGKVLADLRLLAGMEQFDLANAAFNENRGCKLASQNISAYERGEKKPTAVTLDAMVKALKRALAKKGLEWDPRYLRALVCTPALDAAISNSSMDEEGLGWYDDAEAAPGEDAILVWLVTTIEGKTALVPRRLPRRAVLAAGGAGLAAALTGLLDADELHRVQAAIVRPAQADMATVGHLEELLANYRRLDDVGVVPARLLGLVRPSLDLVDHLRRDARAPVRQALLSVSAQYQQLVGGLYTVGGDPRMGQRAYDQALARATEAGDLALAGYIVARKGWHSASDGDVDTALGLASAARQPEWRGTPAVQAHAVSLEARAWALAGKRVECMRKLDEATDFLAASAGQGGGEPPWIYWFTREYLATEWGTCFAKLGETARAIETFDGALAGLLPAEWVRERAYCLLYLATAYVDGGDPEQAAVMGQEAAHIAIGSGSGRIVGRLVDLHTTLMESHSDVGAVRALGDLLHST